MNEEDRYKIKILESIRDRGIPVLYRGKDGYLHVITEDFLNFDVDMQGVIDVQEQTVLELAHKSDVITLMSGFVDYEVTGEPDDASLMFDGNSLTGSTFNDLSNPITITIRFKVPLKLKDIVLRLYAHRTTPFGSASIGCNITVQYLDVGTQMSVGASLSVPSSGAVYHKQMLDGSHYVEWIRISFTSFTRVDWMVVYDFTATFTNALIDNTDILKTYAFATKEYNLLTGKLFNVVDVVGSIGNGGSKLYYIDARNENVLVHGVYVYAPGAVVVNAYVDPDVNSTGTLLSIMNADDRLNSHVNFGVYSDPGVNSNGELIDSVFTQFVVNRFLEKRVLSKTYLIEIRNVSGADLSNVVFKMDVSTVE